MNLCEQLNKEINESSEDHIKKGYKTITGKVLSDEEVEAYNNLTDKINSYLKKGKKPPEELLNGRFNLFYQSGLKEEFKKIDEAVSDKDKLELIKGDFINVLGSHIVDKASDEDLLELLALTSKRDKAWAKHDKDMKDTNEKINMIYRKYRDDNGPCGIY